VTRRRRQPQSLPVRTTRRADGRVALEVGGVVQSIGVPEEEASAGGYWAAMLPDTCPRRALLLGLGGGTVARLLSRRCPHTEMVGIERDETVLAVARADFGLDDVPRLTVVRADAFVWVPDAAEREPGVYDFICLDLFNAGRLAPGALATPFLRQVAALLTSSGTLAVNLMSTARVPEQLHRLERVYQQLRTVRVAGNVVSHLRPLPIS
jgi:spermidine synthase